MMFCWSISSVGKRLEGTSGSDREERNETSASHMEWTWNRPKSLLVSRHSLRRAEKDEVRY